MKLTTKTTILSWLILIALMITWGSSFILIKKGLTVFSSMQVGALRVCIAFLVLIPFAFKRIKELKRKHWLVLFFVSLGSAAPAFLFPMAQVGIDSATAGILNSLTPLFTMLVGVLLFHLKVKWFNVLGVMIGLLGAAGLISVSGGGNFQFNLGYAIYIIIATIFYAFNGNLIKSFLKDLSSFTITIYSFFFFGIPTLVYLLIGTDFIVKMNEHPQFWEGMAYVATLAIFGTAIALIVFNYLIKITTAVFAASVTYLIPIVALAWGILDGERFGLIHILWISCVLFGVFLVNAKRFLWFK
ncbi:MAG: EamA family transporter [Bacteroidetes bacterium]|nr:EamA family transporter [Bacteroidota bacterium]